MARQENLLTVAGSCNAYGGIGDPYLPFREILNLLTGDVEAWWRTGDISGELARRLWLAAPETIRLLVDKGECLLDVFVSGAALARRAARFASTGAPWATQLAAILNHKATGNSPSGLAQVDLFKTLTTVLHMLARRHPLLLALDNLQWADAGSISLLFHLGRRLVGHHILVMGMFRPSDIALGRDGQRHPLEPVIHEFQRLFGGQPLDLRQSEGQQFVEHILETETNALSSSFKKALYRHTRGQPLFTLETLRGMQERGDLIRDEDGRWVEGPAVDWDTLPARVDGVIAERIARLPEELSKTLKIAAVEGEFFTAEVAGALQGFDEAEMTRQLSHELGRRHRLVKGQGSEWRGNQRLSRYRFRHSLFQKYIYNSLDAVERVHLHEQVGRRLEQLYEGETEVIAGQLARHFEAADMPEKALDYWRQAGDLAARVYANTEAITHYCRALNLSGRLESAAETVTSLYLQLGRALELDSQFEQARETYREMEQLARQRADDSMELASLIALMTIQAAPTAVHQAVEAQSLGQRALTLARQLNDQAAEAKILWILSLACYFDNQLAQAIEHGEHSLKLARRLNLRSQMAQTLNDLGSFCYMYSGKLPQAKEALHEAATLWRETDNLPMLADSLASATVAHVYMGEFDLAFANSAEAYQISHSINNIWGQSYSRWKTGLAHWEQGNWGQAIAVMEESIRLGELAGFLIPQTNTRAELATLYGELGAVERGLDTIGLSLAIAETQNPVQTGPGLGVLARLQLLNGDINAAKASIARAQKQPYQETWPVFFVPVTIGEVELNLKLGDYNRGVEVSEKLLTQLRQFRMRIHIPYVLYLQGQALLGAGQKKMAYNRLLQARSEAEAIGSQRTLWRIFYALSQLAPDPAAAETMRQQAQNVVKTIVASLGDEYLPLRRSFLNLPNVGAVYNPAKST